MTGSVLERRRTTADVLRGGVLVVAGLVILGHAVLATPEPVPA